MYWCRCMNFHVNIFRLIQKTTIFLLHFIQKLSICVVYYIVVYCSAGYNIIQNNRVCAINWNPYNTIYLLIRTPYFHIWLNSHHMQNRVFSKMFCGLFGCYDACLMHLSIFYHFKASDVCFTESQMLDSTLIAAVFCNWEIVTTFYMKLDSWDFDFL